MPAAPPALTMPGGCWIHLGVPVSAKGQGMPHIVSGAELDAQHVLGLLVPRWMLPIACPAAGTQTLWIKTTMEHTWTLISQGQILWLALGFPPKFHCSSSQVPWQCCSP